MAQNLISCDLHDYIEVACMYGYQLKLFFRNGDSIEGKAIDVVNLSDMKEYLILDNGLKTHVELTQLAKMQVLTPNAKFAEVIFEPLPDN